MRFSEDGAQRMTPEGFTDAMPFAYVCEKGNCRKHAVADCKRKPIPLWARLLALVFGIRIDYSWQNEPIALCEKHAKGHVVLHRFKNNDGKVML